MLAEKYIKEFGLLPHPEGGYFIETYRDEKGFKVNSKVKSFSTLIYYLLRSGEISRFHRIPSDEIWHFYDGSILELHSISPEGIYDIQVLGRDIRKPNFQAIVPANHLMAARVPQENSFALIGCTVAPGFDFEELYFPTEDELFMHYPYHISMIQEFFKYPFLSNRTVDGAEIL